jgi:LysR family transcriptional repressor of citA
MNTEQLETFIYLSKIKNFTNCAQKLGIAQSTVTNRIYELEKDINAKLFLRGTKKVKLTEQGQIFLGYAQRILELQNSSMEELASTTSHRRKFTIGAINSSYETCVKPLIDRCLTGNSETTVKVILGHSLDLIQQLHDNVVDVVFSAIPVKKKGFMCEPYATDRLALVCAKGKNEYPQGITKSKLGNIPYLMCNITLSSAGEFMRSFFPANHVFKLEVDNSSKLLPFLKDGFGYSFLPYKMIEKEIENGELEEVQLRGFEAPQVTTYIIYRTEYDVSRLLENKFEED